MVTSIKLPGKHFHRPSGITRQSILISPEMVQFLIGPQNRTHFLYRAFGHLGKPPLASKCAEVISWSWVGRQLKLMFEPVWKLPKASFRHVHRVTVQSHYPPECNLIGWNVSGVVVHKSSAPLHVFIR